jgi:hypothetical protein
VARCELRDHKGVAAFNVYRDGPRRLAMRLSNEATLASVVSIIRQVSPAPFAPSAVHLRHAAPRSTAIHRGA